MKNTKFVIPIDGVIVRFPETMIPLPKSGAMVPWDNYWKRRYRDKSIEIAQIVAPVISDVEEKEEIKHSTINKRRK